MSAHLRRSPSTKAEDVCLCGLSASVPFPGQNVARPNAGVGRQSEALIAGMLALRMWLDQGTFVQFSWTFLRLELARERRLTKVSARPLAPSENFYDYVKELARYCVILQRPLGAKPLDLDFSDNFF